jgi:hypothetical protein
METSMARHGRPRLSNVEKLIGRSGWLRVSLLSVNPADPQIGQRQRLLISGLSDDSLESVLFDGETADDLFLVLAESTPDGHRRRLSV